MLCECGAASEGLEQGLHTTCSCCAESGWMGKLELQGGAEGAVEWGSKSSRVGQWELQDGAARATEWGC